jgi:hypothetical protein
MAHQIYEPDFSGEKEFRKTKLKNIEFYLSHLSSGELLAIEKLAGEICKSNSKSYKDWLNEQEKKRMPEHLWEIMAMY